jgi:transcription termination factor NusB
LELRKGANGYTGILRLAIYELKHEPLTPTPVIINEYIEITKDFFEEKETAL